MNPTWMSVMVGALGIATSAAQPASTALICDTQIQSVDRLVRSVSTTADSSLSFWREHDRDFLLRFLSGLSAGDKTQLREAQGRFRALNSVRLNLLAARARLTAMDGELRSLFGQRYDQSSQRRWMGDTRDQKRRELEAGNQRLRMAFPSIDLTRIRNTELIGEFTPLERDVRAIYESDVVPMERALADAESAVATADERLTEIERSIRQKESEIQQFIAATLRTAGFPDRASVPQDRHAFELEVGVVSGAIQQLHEGFEPIFSNRLTAAADGLSWLWHSVGANGEAHQRGLGKTRFYGEPRGEAFNRFRYDTASGNFEVCSGRNVRSPVWDTNFRLQISGPAMCSSIPLLNAGSVSRVEGWVHQGVFDPNGPELFTRANLSEFNPTSTVAIVEGYLNAVAPGLNCFAEWRRMHGQ